MIHAHSLYILMRSAYFELESMQLCRAQEGAWSCDCHVKLCHVQPPLILIYRCKTSVQWLAHTCTLQMVALNPSQLPCRKLDPAKWHTTCPDMHNVYVALCVPSLHLAAHVLLIMPFPTCVCV